MQGSSDNPTVLVVDDDLDILAALRDLLEHQGYRVTCASTCRDALAQAMGFRYHVVLLDIGLPDGDGLSVLDLLRKQHPLLPVIILTIFCSPEYRAGSLSHGAVSCVNKPYDQDVLRGLLRLAIQARTFDGPGPPIIPPSPSQDS